MNKMKRYKPTLVKVLYDYAVLLEYTSTLKCEMKTGIQTFCIGLCSLIKL